MAAAVDGRAGRRRARAGRPRGSRSPRASTSGGARWSATRTSQSGSRSSRRTTAEPIVPAPPVTSTRAIRARARPARVDGVADAGAEQRRRLGGVDEHLRGAQAVPRIDEQAVVGGQRDGSSRSARGPLERRSGWWRRSPRRRPGRPRPAAGSASAACGSQTATSASSRSSSRISLGDSESRSSSVSRLKVRPSTATLREARLPIRRLIPSTRNSGTPSLTRETASSMPGALRALLGEGEVLAQAGAGGQPRHRDPAARVVVVDQVDHLEHVGAVALAVHHQQVGQRERRVAQDVGPDLGQLGLHRGGLDDRRAEHAEQRGGALGRALADAADDARQRRDLLQELARRRSARARGRRTRPRRRAGRGASPGSRRRTRWCRGRSSSAGSARGRGAAAAAGRRARRAPGAGRTRRGRTTGCRS